MKTDKPVNDDACERTLREFLDTTIDPNRFDHMAHIEVAWMLLGRHSFDEALEQMETGLQRLVAKHGIEGKYHATVTGAMMVLIDASMREAAGDESRTEFLDRNRDLATSASTVLRRYYGGDLLMSDEARTQFVPPDLTPLPRVLNRSGRLTSAA